MTGALTEATGKDGGCRTCGARLGLLQRVSKQEFCSPAHRNQFLRVQEQLALACLQESQTPNEESRKPLEDFVDPSDDLLEAAFADPTHTETGPVAAPVPNAPVPSPNGSPDPDEAGFIGFNYRAMPGAVVLLDQEAESPSTILQVFPETAASKTRDVFLPEGGYVWNLAPLQSRRSVRFLETDAELHGCPSAALPRLACTTTTAEFEFAREDAPERPMECVRDPEKAEPATLAHPQPPAPDRPATQLAMACEGPGSQRSAPLSGSCLFPMAAPLARVMPASIRQAAQDSLEALPAAPAVGSLVERTHPPSLCHPPAPRKGMRAKLGVRDPGAHALLDPLPCPFGSEEQAWQAEP